MGLFDDNLITSMPRYFDVFLWMEDVIVKEIEHVMSSVKNWSDPILRWRIIDHFLDMSESFPAVSICPYLQSMGVSSTNTDVCTYGGNIHICVGFEMDGGDNHKLRVISPLTKPDFYIKLYDNERIR